jgi:Uncharacterised nucleotidyltransferase/Transglutaminase-like superfamily
MPKRTPSNLEEFVMGNYTVPISAKLLINARLAGYAYRNTPENHSLHEALRQPRRNLEIQHQLVKHQLVPLIHVWNDAGIKVMLIKGFWLAEFIYERPGDRGYGDIDVLMPEEQTQHAIQLAQDLGWKIVFNNKTIGNPHSHEEANLSSSDGLVTIDLHRYALQSVQSWGEYHPKRLTSTFWETAIQQPWEGTTIWLPNPMDGLILNLLNRARGDHWKRRISDLPDAQTIITYAQITQEQFVVRADELNVKNTIIAALETCNPWKNHVDIAIPTIWHKLGLYFRTASEIGIYALEQLQFKIWRPINSIIGLVKIFPIFLSVKHELKHQKDLYQIFQKLEHRFLPKKKTSNPEILCLTRGVRLALLLFGPRQDGCVPRSMALYLVLRKCNVVTEFVSGIQRLEGKLQGHAWLEWQGRPIEGLGDHNAPDLFKENFRYPNS